MSTKTIADPRRQVASQAAYRARRYPHMGHPELEALAPHLSPAELAERLAKLTDALTAQDGIATWAATAHHLVADRLGSVDPKHIPAAATDTYSKYIAAAKLRKAIYTRANLYDLEGHTDLLDEAIQKWRDAHSGYAPYSEVEPEFAHPEVLTDEAEEDLAAALGDLMWHVVERMDSALAQLRKHADEQVEQAFTALIGGGR